MRRHILVLFCLLIIISMIPSYSVSSVIDGVSVSLKKEAPRYYIEPSIVFPEYSFANKTEIAKYIASLQTPDGGFSKSKGYGPTLNYTALALIALSILDYEYLVDLDTAFQFIKDCQNPDGGFGNLRYYQDYDVSTLYNSYLATLALYLYGQLSIIDVNGLKNYVKSLYDSSSGSWGSTFLTAFAVGIMKMLDATDELSVSDIVDYIISNPPRGVNYAGSAYLNTPSDEYPSIYSTWAGVYTLTQLNYSTYYSPDKIGEWLAEAQTDSGGFKFSPYVEYFPEIYATFYAVDTLALMNAEYSEYINAWKAAVYSLTIASVSDDLGKVAFAVTVLNELQNIIVPKSIYYNATSVIQGDTIFVKIELITSFGDTLSGASVSITYSGIEVICLEKSEGVYEGLISTISLDNGTYTTRINIRKQGYEDLTLEVVINVFKYIYVASVVVSKYPVTVGENITVFVELVDRAGNVVTGATVKITLADETVRATEISAGTYKGELIPRVPGNMRLVIYAEKEGFQDLVYEELLPVLARNSPQTRNPFELDLASGFMIALTFGVIINSFDPRKGRKLILLRILLGLIPTTIVYLFVNSGVMSSIPVLSDFLRSVSGLTTVFIWFFTIIFIMQLEKDARKPILRIALSWNLSFTLFLVFAYFIGATAFFIGSIILIVGAIAYIIAPSERESIFNLIRNTFVYWTVPLMALSIVMSFLKNPYFMQGALAPPSAISISAYGYFALIWVILFVMVPFGYISQLIYKIVSVIRKPPAEELVRELSTRGEEEM